MKLTTILSTLLVSSFTAAQDYVQSKPFQLVIQSEDKSINGKKFVSCHTGAAIESLCIYGDDGSNFQFNTTKGSPAPIKGYTPSGLLTWNLPLDPQPLSQPLTFYIDPSTNVALPLFQPTDQGQQVAFDSKNQLVVFSYLDDSKSPAVTDKVRAIRNWYVCKTNYLGYDYQTLAWTLGGPGAKPQNPTCIKVDVLRKFKK